MVFLVGVVQLESGVLATKHRVTGSQANLSHILFRANAALICKCFDRFRLFVCEPPWSRWKCSWIRENSHCTTYLRFLDAPRSLNSPKTDLGVSWSLYAS